MGTKIKCCVDRLRSPPITVHPSTSGRSVLLAYTVRTIRPSLTYDAAVATVKPENTCAIGAASGGSTMVDLTIGNNMNDLSLSVLVQKCGEKFIWELRRDGLSQAIKFSAPIYLSKKEAKTSGENVRTTYIIRNASKKSTRRQPKAPHFASAR
jgi:hypothetical protein